MLGTLNGALEARGIRLGPADIRADVAGTNAVNENRVIVLNRIDIRYHLHVPAGSREVVERALARHQEKCPTAQSLNGAVEVAWTAEIEEVT